MLKKGDSLRDVATGEVLRVVDIEPCYGESKEMVMLGKVGVRRDKVELTALQRKVKAEIYRHPPGSGKSFLIAHLYEHDKGAREIVSDKEAAEEKEKDIHSAIHGSPAYLEALNLATDAACGDNSESEEIHALKKEISGLKTDNNSLQRVKDSLRSEVRQRREAHCSLSAALLKKDERIRELEGKIDKIFKALL